VRRIGPTTASLARGGFVSYRPSALCAVEGEGLGRGARTAAASSWSIWRVAWRPIPAVLRLPTGIFYAQGVKANVLFFNRKPASEDPWTKDLWIYDLRTNQHFTLKTNPLGAGDLEEFVASYKPGKRGKREESERFKKFSYDELVAREKASLYIFWLRDESLEDLDNLLDPATLAAEIVEDLEAALAEFSAIAEALGGEEAEAGGA
jgi:type I restriction enzyme M protein